MWAPRSADNRVRGCSRFRLLTAPGRAAHDHAVIDLVEKRFEIEIDDDVRAAGHAFPGVRTAAGFLVHPSPNGMGYFFHGSHAI
jgi:hypothetical protein